jgi:hypothetical protein
MKIDTSDKYEIWGATYQFELIKIIDEKLREAKIAKSRRSELCGAIAFALGVFHDGGQVKVKGKASRPLVAFQDKRMLRLPSVHFAFHEYAYGNTFEYFESIARNTKRKARRRSA